MKDFQSYLKETGEIGYVQSIASSIFYVSGLPTARLNELVVTENGLVGIVKAVLPQVVEVMVFEGQSLGHNMKVVRTNEFFQVPVSKSFLGRIVDPFGVPQDHLEPIKGVETYRQTDPAAPDIDQRVKITRPFETGVMASDLLVPIGMGQRELILGDQKTGKTTFALSAIASAAKRGIISIYASIGKKKSDLKFVQEYLKEVGVLGKTIIIGATSADPAPMVYLAPFSAMAIAEYFRDQGQDTLVVLDDMTTHAKFYREISLLSRRPPGRQSYPGDIFHLHARIVERAGNFKTKNNKTASITLLPIGETQEGDLSGYIQTNLMAMTDGHIFFDVAEAKKGRYPAVSFTLSVTRVGNQTQTPLMREIGQKLNLKLSEFRKSEALGRFGIELSAQTAQAIKESEKLEAILGQESHVIYDSQISILFAGIFFAGLANNLAPFEIRQMKERLQKMDLDSKLSKIKSAIGNCQTVAELVSLINNNLKTLMPPKSFTKKQTDKNPIPVPQVAETP